MSAHTPGPWRVRAPATIMGCNTRGQRYIHAKDVTIACTLDGEKDANARLIAAAPLMLEELQAAHFTLSAVLANTKNIYVRNLIEARMASIRVAIEQAEAA
jgi:hypothetical protein